VKDLQDQLVAEEARLVWIALAPADHRCFQQAVTADPGQLPIGI